MPIEEAIEYSPVQTERMNAAVASDWRPLFDPNHKLIIHERDDVNTKLK
jgi:hypothetical protein